MSSISSFYHRRASSSTSSQPVMTTVIPFRNAEGEIRYTSAPALPSHKFRSATQNTYPTLQNHDRTYDSDGEPLLHPTIRSHNYHDLTDDEKARFTATGRPMYPQYSRNPLQNMSLDMFAAPQFLPKQYTDESIIPAIVVNVIPSQKSIEQKKRRKSITNILRGEKSQKDAEKGITKIVFMPRGEYLKHFAKDEKANYIGTAPQRQWTEDELDEKYGHYRPIPKYQKGVHNAWSNTPIIPARGF